ncbi:HEAT repeat domain-containing protein [Foetidibacter luteolus]|uniref:HEAT repeat domain-containing protein n=1 Tax=Foetidibacter luteolus TaxID=2608880 RepID=UPI00129B8A96|nr:HEAT repeat domain-containing protein [Foetidibacter luteolus]
MTLIFAFSFYLTSCKDEKKAVVDSIIKRGVYEGMYLGSTDSISPQWKNYEALTKKFSEKELIELCNHTNPIVRCYAFKALTEIQSPKVYNVLLQHLSDTAEFNRNYGCIGDYDRVTDNFLDEVGYDKRDSTNFRLTEAQYNQIDSILLYRDEIKKRSWLGSIEFRSRRYMLQRTKPLPQLYVRIKEIVEDGVYEALPLLAQYKNLSDTIIFKKLLLDDEFSNRGRTLKNYVRNSVRYFPSPAFYPILKEQLLAEIGTNAISDRYESFPLYIALVQYPTTDTKILFETALKKSDDEFEQRSKFINDALKKYPSKIFEGLIKNEQTGN